MSTTATPRVNSSGYTLGEEIANAVTSCIATALSVAGLVVLVVTAARYGNVWHIVGVSVFGVSLIASHLASTLYHSISPANAKRKLKLFDHLAIYFLIAGTYTPFTLVNIRGGWGWSVFALIWFLAGVGVVLKLSPLNNRRYLSTLFYVAMGWVVLLVIKPLLANVAVTGVLLLVAGGLFYTAGVAFYAWRSLAYNHAIWHVFVIAGSTAHFFAVLWYAAPWAVPAAA